MQDGTPFVDFLIFVVLVGWALVGAVVFVDMATLISLSSRRRASDAQALS